MSGAHFNPVVSLADAFFGCLAGRDLPAYPAAQVAGAISGAIVANLMFQLDAITWSTQARSSSGLGLSGALATIGLLVVIFGVVSSGRANAAPFAVGSDIGAATSSRLDGLRRPAVTIGRAFSDTFAGIKPMSGARVHRVPSRGRRTRGRIDPRLSTLPSRSSPTT